jgi:hypothetical protein
LEKSLEGVLFLLFYLEPISLGLFSHLDQPIRLLSLPMDASSVYKKKDPGGQA